jgi:ankyrin repeat protein
MEQAGNGETDLGAKLLDAVEQRDVLLVLRLIELGANVNYANGFGHTPLHKAVCHKFTELVPILLKVGANPTQTNVYGDAPMHIAAQLGNVEILKLLVDAGALSTQTNNIGVTPLFYAARNHPRAFVYLLLISGTHGEHLPGLMTTARLDYNPKTKWVVQYWPAVPSLTLLTLRVVLCGPNKLEIPGWIPPLLLEFGNTQEGLDMNNMISPKQEKKTTGNSENSNSKKRERETTGNSENSNSKKQK